MEKRSRSDNFTSHEQRILIDSVEIYAHVIENKKTDTVTIQQKHEAWDNVLMYFNSQFLNKVHTVKSIKIKYEGIKRQIKKKDAKRRQELFKTGGGTPDIPNFTDYEEKLMKLLDISVAGLPPRNNCDSGTNMCSPTYVLVEPSTSTYARSVDEQVEPSTSPFDRPIDVKVEPSTNPFDRPIDVQVEPSTSLTGNVEDIMQKTANNSTPWGQLRKKRTAELRTPLKEKSELNCKYSKIAESRSTLVDIQLEAAQLDVQVNKAKLEKLKIETKLYEEKRIQKPFAV